MSVGSGQQRSIPITVIGGYLGAGKTTLLNQMLRDATGVRLGVVVNDFGEMGIDAQLLDRGGDVPVLNLANGCVCCTLGDDLRETLAMLADVEPPLDHIVIEASGVADPANTAAWGTVAPFVPGGVVVLASAASIRQQVTDRYVGGEVMRQLLGADLIVLTKIDSCSELEAEATRDWMAQLVAVPVVESTFGDVPVDVVLDPRLSTGATSAESSVHEVAGYIRWQHTWSGTTSVAAVRSFVESLPPGVLRLKGFVAAGAAGEEPVTLLVQVVGTSSEVTVMADEWRESSLSAIGRDRVLDASVLDDLVQRLL